MKTISLPSLLMSSTLLFAQTPEIISQSVFGGSSEDKLDEMVQALDGGLVLAGSSFSNSSADKSENRIGGYDYWVVKLDILGNIEWENTIGGAQDDVLTGLVATTDGGYLLGGYTLSDISGDKTEHTQGGYDYWVVKLDDLGTIEWQNGIGGSNHDHLLSILQSSDGGYLLTGSSKSTISGDKTDPAEGGDYNVDYWILKLDASGEITWQQTIGGNDYDEPNTAIEDMDGNFIIAGNSFSPISGDKDEAGFGYAPWLVKLDASGNLIWQKCIQITSGGDPIQMIQKSNGNILVATQTTSPAGYDKTTAGFGGVDYWIFELNTADSIEQQWSFGGTSNDYITSMALDNTNGLYIVGYTESGISGNKSEATYGINDYWLVHIDSTGNIIYDKAFGGSAQDYAVECLLDDSGQPIIAGYSYSGITGNKNLPTLGYSDFWVLELEEVYTPCAFAPEGLYVDFITATTAKLHWDDDPDAVKYKIQYRKSTTPGWTNTSAIPNVKNLFSLEPSTTYLYKVRSICGAGIQSDWSETFSFTTSALRLGGSEESIAWNIYPNPTMETINIDWHTTSSKSTVPFTILNAQGVPVLAGNIKVGVTEIGLEQLPSGLYTIQVDHTSSKTFIKF
jgi:hypothetical protein